MKNVFFQELDNNFVVICLARDGFNPFGYVIYSHQDVLVPKWARKRTHKVNAPNVKEFYFQNCVYGHHITFRNSSYHLASCARLAKVKCIFKQSGLIEPALQNFFSYFTGTKVSIACNLVTKSQNTHHFLIGNTSPNDFDRNNIYRDKVPPK